MQFIKSTWNQSLSGKITISVIVLAALFFIFGVASALTSRQPPSATSAVMTQAALATANSAPTAPAPAASTDITGVTTAAAVATDLPTEQPITTTTPSGQAYVQAAKGARVRSGPGTTYKIVVQLKGGEQLPVTGKNADATWWQVTYKNNPAWISSDVVTFHGDAATIQIVEAP